MAICIVLQAWKRRVRNCSVLVVPPSHYQQPCRSKAHMRPSSANHHIGTDQKRCHQSSTIFPPNPSPARLYSPWCNHASAPASVGNHSKTSSAKQKVARDSGRDIHDVFESHLGTIRPHQGIRTKEKSQLCRGEG